MIRKFLKGSKEKAKSKKYSDLSKNRSEEDKREIELALLKPDKIPSYTGPTPIKNSLDKLTVKIILPDEKSMSLLRKYFKVGTFVEQSINNISLLLELLRLLESGKLEFDKHEKRLRIHTKAKQENSKRKQKMDKRKQGDVARKRNKVSKSKNFKRGS